MKREIFAAELINLKFSKDEKDGIYVEEYPSGHIKHVGYYKDGEAVRTLDISEGEIGGTFMETPSEKFAYYLREYEEDDYMLYEDGYVSEPEEIVEGILEQKKEEIFIDWLKDKIRLIEEAKEGPFRCSFCSQASSEVEKLIAGPKGVHICSECVDLCADIVSNEAEIDPLQ